MEKKDDRVCAQCGYSLKGLPRRGNCPECGNFFSVPTGEGISYATDQPLVVTNLHRKLRTIAWGVVLLATLLGLGLALAFEFPHAWLYWLGGAWAVLVAFMLAHSFWEQIRSAR